MLQAYGTSLSVEAIKILLQSQLNTLGFGACYHGVADVWCLKDLGSELTAAVEVLAQGIEQRLSKSSGR